MYVCMYVCMKERMQVFTHVYLAAEYIMTCAQNEVDCVAVMYVYVCVCMCILCIYVCMSCGGIHQNVWPKCIQLPRCCVVCVCTYLDASVYTSVYYVYTNTYRSATASMCKCISVQMHLMCVNAFVCEIWLTARVGCSSAVYSNESVMFVSFQLYMHACTYIMAYGLERPQCCLRQTERHVCIYVRMHTCMCR